MLIHPVFVFITDPVFESQGTAGVRGTEGFSEGEFYWEVIFTEPMFGTSVMVGIGTKMALLHLDNYQYVNMLGMRIGIICYFTGCLLVQFHLFFKNYK